jgi:hypothetical protein
MIMNSTLTVVVVWMTRTVEIDDNSKNLDADVVPTGILVVMPMSS